MANTLTLGQLMTQVRSRADLLPQNYTPATTQNITIVSDQELIGYINHSYQELYGIILQKFGDDYFVAPPLSFQTDGTSQYYTLPNGTNYSAAPSFQKLLAVDMALTNAANSYITLKPFMMSERNRYSVPGVQNSYGYTRPRYRLLGNQIWFTPIPAANLSMQIYYIPELTLLSAITDVASDLGGWLEYVIVDAAMKCMQKEESDVSVLAMQKGALIQRIEAEAENRDAGMPQTVSDVRGMDYNDGSDRNGGFNGY